MPLNAIETQFWLKLRNGTAAFAYLAGEDYLTGPVLACAEGERVPIWLLTPPEAPLIRRLHRNDNAIAMAAANDSGISTRLAGKVRRVEDAFSLQRIGRMTNLPWPLAALASCVPLRLDLTELSFWLPGDSMAMRVGLDEPRKLVASAEIVPITAAASR